MGLFWIGEKGWKVSEGDCNLSHLFSKVATKNGNTSNLLAHLRTTHSNLHLHLKAAMMKESLATLGASTSRKMPADQLSLAESVDRVQRWYERI